jgi:phosphoribosyl-ATP pyrophosphohydrolase/phosphoribosyl-AMP cyclohydrolase
MSMVSIDELKYDEKGLIPAIVQDAETKRVLTLAYMNRESLRRTLECGQTVFWSRSRQEYWHKGETSGNYQHIVKIIADCDRDALTVLVRKDGPACHMGTESCFEYPLTEVEEEEKKLEEKKKITMQSLYELLEERKMTKPEGSYTSYLFDQGIDKILKKVGEEAAEVIIAAKSGDRGETVYETADLAYHVMVMLAEMGIPLSDVEDEMARRRVIDQKKKQTYETAPVSPENGGKSE